MLTPKQEKFALAIAEGMTQSAAYRGSYDALTMQPATVWNEASKLMRNPEVATRIATLKAKVEQVGFVTMMDRREAILLRLEHEAMTARSDSARIRALELLGKHVGLFEDQVSVQGLERTEEDVVTSILQRLSVIGLTEAQS